VRKTKFLTARSELIRRDSKLPGLSILLNPDHLLTKLSDQLDIKRVDSIELAYIRYKPGMNCLVRYVLNVDGVRLGAYAKAHGEDAVSKLGKSAERQVFESVLGPGRVVLNDHQVIFSTFPNDAKLSSLQCLADDEFRGRLLKRLFGGDSNWRACSFDQSLNYKPERRYVARLRNENGDSALAKFYSRSGYDKARLISRKLGNGVGGFFPETLGRSKKHSIVAYRWQPGETPRQLQADGNLSANDLKLVIGSLTEFHASKCGGLTSIDSADQIKQLHAIADLLGFILPKLHQRSVMVAQRLGQRLDIEAPAGQPVHGDFYDKQILVSDGNARLIDLDAARRGNPLLDLGCYLSHLERQAASQRLSREKFEFQKEILTSEFARLSGDFSEHQLANFTAMGLFQLIHHPFRDWEPGWPEQTELLLDRVESLISD
jgi:hypothetical protein